MSTGSDIFDRALLERRKSRAVTRWHAGPNSRPPGLAFLLERATEDLTWRVGAIDRHFGAAAAVGSYHGLSARSLRALPNVGLLLETERCPELLRTCHGPCIAADEEALPFRDASLDLIVSALSLQWVNDLPGVLLQMRRALKPDGALLATLLAGESLTELRLAMLAAETEIEGGASPRVSPFADIRDLGALLQRAGFALPVADIDRVTVTYSDMFALLGDLRASGATNVLNDRRRTPMRRATLMRAAEIYQREFAAADGRIRATFEIATLTGWVPHESQQQPLRRGSAQNRLADALGTREHRLREVDE